VGDAQLLERAAVGYVQAARTWYERAHQLLKIGRLLQRVMLLHSCSTTGLPLALNMSASRMSSPSDDARIASICARSPCVARDTLSDGVCDSHASHLGLFQCGRQLEHDGGVCDNGAAQESTG